jgi:hypothetical protein
MKKQLYNFLFLLFLILGNTAFSQITWPKNGQVFQRMPNLNNTATVGIGGKFTESTNSVQYKLERYNNSNALVISQDWTNLGTNFASKPDGNIVGSITCEQGYYKLSLKNPTSNQEISTEFGVGDVFIIAGQSNATGWPVTNITSPNPLQDYQPTSANSKFIRCLASNTINIGGIEYATHNLYPREEHPNYPNNPNLSISNTGR